MIQQNKYNSNFNSIENVLEHIDNFESIINKFQYYHSEYKYEINYRKLNNRWNVEIMITNEKQTNTQTSRNSLRACSVL